MKKLLLASCLAVALPAGAADFTPLDRQRARALSDPGQHRQPTIVALWAADCSHCKKNLSLFASMARSDKRLRVITVAAEPATPALGPLLDQYNLPGPRYAYGNDAPEALAYALDPAWAGELPRTFLFDGKGREKRISGVLNPEDARRAVAPH